MDTTTNLSRTPGWRAVLVLVGLLLGALPARGAPAAWGAPAAPAAVYEEATFPSADGTSLWAQIWRPADAGPDGAPVVLVVTPYSWRGVEGMWERPEMLDAAVERGWNLVIVSLRGYGESEGCGDMFGPGEQADVAAAVNWAAEAAFSNGRVAMYGHSYGGITGIMALAQDLPLAGVVMAGTVSSYYDALTHDGVHFQSWHDDAARFGYYQLGSGDRPTLPTCMAEVLANDRQDGDRNSPFFAAREYSEGAAGTTTPVLWSRGFWEPLQGDNLLPLLTSLRGEVRGSFGHFGHDWAPRRDQFDQEMAFLAHHLEGGPAPDGPPIRVQDNLGYWRGEQTWPPADVQPHTVALRPGAYRDLAGADHWAPAADTVWTVLEPVATETRISGGAVVRLDVGHPNLGTPRAIVNLYDVAPSGEANLIARGAGLLREAGPNTITLAAVDWVVRPGHRVAVGISGADDARYEGGTTGQLVQLRSGELDLPILGRQRTRFLDGGVPGFAVVARPTTLPALPPASAAAPPSAKETCDARSENARCPRAGAGSVARQPLGTVLLETVIENLQPDPTKFFTFGNTLHGYPAFEVPEGATRNTVSIVADPSELADIDIILLDHAGNFHQQVQSVAHGLDLRREGTALVDLPPGGYTVLVRQIALEQSLAPTGRPVDVDLRVVMRTAPQPTGPAPRRGGPRAC